MFIKEDTRILTNYSLNTSIDLAGVFPVRDDVLQGEGHPSLAKRALGMTHGAGFLASSEEFIDKYLILQYVTSSSPGSAGCIIAADYLHSLLDQIKCDLRKKSSGFRV